MLYQGGGTPRSLMQPTAGNPLRIDPFIEANWKIPFNVSGFKKRSLPAISPRAWQSPPQVSLEAPDPGAWIPHQTAESVGMEVGMEAVGQKLIAFDASAWRYARRGTK